MTLYETTRELVKRGCPEHPRLEWTRAWDEPLGIHVPIWGYPIPTPKVAANPDGTVTQAYSEIDDSDARDLWTMHATMWWLQQATRQQDRRITHWHDNSMYEVRCGVRDMTSARTEDWTWESVGGGSDALAAILAATANLSPGGGE